jgi:hypothetical protein
MSKNNGFEMVTNTTRYDDNGNKYLDVVLRNPRTGEMKVSTQHLGIDADKRLDMATSRVTLSEKMQKLVAESAPKEGDYGANYKGTIYGSESNPLGWDLDGEVGDPIYSPVGGTVVSVKTEAQTGGKKGWGNQVKIRDDAGNIVTLNHLDDWAVSSGEYVYPGQVVASMGKTGAVVPIHSDGAHLDLSVYRPNGSQYTLAQVQEYVKENYKPVVGKLSSTDLEKELKAEIAKIQGMTFADEVLSSGNVAKTIWENIGEPTSSQYLSAEDYVALRNVAVKNGMTMQDFDKMFEAYKDPLSTDTY